MNSPGRIMVRPHWPRLLSERDAAAYLSIGTTTLRDRGPSPKRVGARVLWDLHDLDRWADALDGQPLGPAEAEQEALEVQRRFLERRERAKQRQ